MTNTCPFHSFMVYFIKSRQTVIIRVWFIQNWLYSNIFLITTFFRNTLVITYTLYVNICLYLNALSTTLLVITFYEPFKMMFSCKTSFNLLSISSTLTDVATLQSTFSLASVFAWKICIEQFINISISIKNKVKNMYPYAFVATSQTKSVHNQISGQNMITYTESLQ